MCVFSAALSHGMDTETPTAVRSPFKCGSVKVYL